MNSPSRRPSISVDDRARPPKKRKYSHIEDISEPSSQVHETFIPEEGIWPAAGILKERGTSPSKEYLVEWKPVKNFAEQDYKPTWV
jgi:hypothetical protein